MAKTMGGTATAGVQRGVRDRAFGLAAPAKFLGLTGLIVRAAVPEEVKRSALNGWKRADRWVDRGPKTFRLEKRGPLA